MAPNIAAATSVLSVFLYTALSVSLVAQGTRQPQIANTSPSKPVASPTLSKVYVIGEVTKPGASALASEMNVIQIIAEAGGLLETANKGNVVVVRNENGQ